MKFFEVLIGTKGTEFTLIERFNLALFCCTKWDNYLDAPAYCVRNTIISRVYNFLALFCYYDPRCIIPKLIKCGYYGPN